MPNLGAVEGEETEHLHLLDGEDGADLGHVEQLHSGLTKKVMIGILISNRTFPYELSEMTNSSHEAKEIKRSQQASMGILNRGNSNCGFKFILELFIFNLTDMMTQATPALSNDQDLQKAQTISQRKIEAICILPTYIILKSIITSQHWENPFVKFLFLVRVLKDPQKLLETLADVKSN